MKKTQRSSQHVPAVLTHTERDIALRCARLCEDMVVVGRAWTHDQEVAAHALFATANAIRGEVTSGRKCATATCRPSDRRCFWRPLQATPAPATPFIGSTALPASSTRPRNRSAHRQRRSARRGRS